jgi:4-hydroxy-tetrahydrodipicolinate synthase
MMTFLKKKKQTKNEILCNVRNTFEKFNLISGLHSFMSNEDKIYKNVLPPVSFLSEKENLQLIEELNKLNFTLESLRGS